MLDKIFYRVCSLFVDIYEITTTQKDLIDHRVTPPQTTHFPAIQTILKNGAIINPNHHPRPRNHRIIYSNHLTRMSWDPIFNVEQHNDTETYRVDISLKIRNILLAAPFAVYLTAQGFLAYADAL